MGHSYAEMFPNGEDTTFRQRYTEYQQACAREISDIIEKNPIKSEEIKIGDKLKLYSPLNGVSKVRLDNKGQYHGIRELFAPSAHYFSSSMWQLACSNFFTVWNKKTETYLGKLTGCFVRIDQPPKNNPFDWNPHWVDIRYFSHTKL